jgi:serine/threonine-protein kinase
MSALPGPSETEPLDNRLDAGLAAAFGPDSGPPIPAGAPVVQALGASLPDVPASVPARYQLHGELARGGMGCVLKGRDVDLGRDIAVKVLLETHAGRTELVQRFVEEARIAGQLQHPSIVPVYDLGAPSSARPYFTMKLVKGHTLAALLHERRGPEEEQPRFVAIFEQVCQALAYAHDRRVTHRDIKPANIMVGAFGEVQVMDWGLAKVLLPHPPTPSPKAGEGEQDAPAPPSPVLGEGGWGGEGRHTQAGSVLGTPAYMAPEQARGDIDLVDERADVFGLGAILCEVLTGKPPFTGKNEEAMRQAKSADLGEALARLDGCGADAELIALAKRCLAAEPQQRPSNAGEVVRAVTAYQSSVASRLKEAEMERAQAQVKAQEERKRRRLAVGLAAAVLALVVVGASGALLVQRQQARRQAEQARHEAERDQAVTAALDKAVSLQQQARWAEARAVLEQAQERLGEEGAPERKQQVAQALANLKLVGELDTIRLESVAMVDERMDAAGADRKYAAAFRAAGLATPGETPEVVAERVKRSTIYPVLVASLDDWALSAQDRARRAWALEVARRADPEDWRNRLRDAVEKGDRKALQKLAGDLAGQAPAIVVLLADALLRVGAGSEAVAVLRRGQQWHPGDFWLNYHLATAWRNSTRPAGRKRCVPTSPPWRCGRPTPAYGTTLGSPCADRAGWRRHWRPFAGPSPSIRSSPWRTSNSPAFWANRTNCPRPSPPAARPSPSSRRPPRPTSPWASF